jgi:hypothetical protein
MNFKCKYIYRIQYNSFKLQKRLQLSVQGSQYNLEKEAFEKKWEAMWSL